MTRLLPPGLATDEVLSAAPAHTVGPLRIAVIGHVRFPIAEPFMGGMEAHGFQLVHALAARGHDVTLFASGDSRVEVPLVPILPRALEAEPDLWGDEAANQRRRQVVGHAYENAARTAFGGKFDIVHNNSMSEVVLAAAARSATPCLTSMHIPPYERLERAAVASASPTCRFTVTSQAQAKSWAALSESVRHVVHNGIDLPAWPYGPAGDGTAIWAGRIMPNKAPHLAIEAARRAGMALTLYGVLEDRDYFDAEVAPRLGGDINYTGHACAAELAQAMRRASLFVFTPVWDEPFGLVLAEAMACGLPVAGFDSGAVAEVVGPTGKVVEAGNTAALAAAMQCAVNLPRMAPRARVEHKFSVQTMIAGYEAAYARCLSATSALPFTYAAEAVPA